MTITAMALLSFWLGLLLLVDLASLLLFVEGFSSNPSLLGMARRFCPIHQRIQSTANSLTSSRFQLTSNRAFNLLNSATDDLEEEDFDESYDDAEDDDNVIDDDTELILHFMEYCQETPVGELELQDAELLRGVIQDFPKDLYKNQEMEVEIVMESLLNRLIDEWSFVNRQLDGDEDNDMDVEYLMEKETLFRPAAREFENVIGAWNRSTNPDKVVRVLNILSDQRQLVLHGSGETSLPEARPSLKTIEYVLETMVDSKERGLEKRAAMVVDSLASDYNMEPNAKITGLMIQMMAKSRGHRAAQNAENMLREAVTKFPPGSEDGMNDIEVFNKVVTAWAKSRNDDGPQRAQDLIVFMDGIGSPECAPNSRTFTSLIDAYAQTNEWSGVRNAETILNNVLDLHLEGRDDLEPNVATWTIVISAYARLCKNPKTAKRNLFEAGRRAGMLLKRMENLHESGRLKAGPDAISYVTVLNAYCFSRDKKNIQEAEIILDEMNERYLDGDDSMKPSVRSVKMLVDSWIRQEEMEKAEAVREKYEDVLEGPDVSEEDLKEFYHAFLHGYCQKGDGRRAKVYLDQMLEDGIEPNVSCYDRLIDTYIKQGDKDCAQKAQEVFKIVERRREEGSLVPNERIYTTFIRAMVRSKVPGLHKKADLVLKRMQNLYEGGLDEVAPSIFTYNVCLNACAESGQIEGIDQAEAFQTAVRLFSDLKRDLNPDHVTYGNLLRCANLLPAESEKKEKYVIATFKLCCEKGFVNNLVLRDLRNASSDDVWTQLTNIPTDVNVKDIEHPADYLPLDWSRNIPPKKDDFRSEPRKRSFSGSFRSR